MNSGPLEQREIDDLLRGIRDGAIKTGRASLAEVAKAAPLDFSDPAWSANRIVRRRLPVLDLVFDRLSPSIQVTLTKSLRFPIRAECVGVSLVKFADFREQFVGSPCLFEVMRLDPLRGYHVMVFDSTVLYALIDAMMGGLGVGEMPRDREVSDIETNLLQKAHADILRDLENAWRPWFPLRVEHVRADRNVQVMSTIDDEEVCHVATLNVAGDVLPSSPIHFVMPYTSLEPLLEATSARVGEEIDPNWRANLERNLRDARANVSAVLGTAPLATSKVQALAAGDIVELERRVDEEIDVRVQDRAVLRGRLGKSGANYGVKVTQRRQIHRRVSDRSAGQTLVRKGLISREQLSVAVVDERINKRPLLDSIVARGWAERRVLEGALQG